MTSTKSTYTTKDIVTIVVIAVISGIVGAGWGYVWNLTFAIPVVGGLISASLSFVWFIAPLVSFHMIRKPRAAAMTQLLGGFIAVLAGHPAGIVAYGWYVLEAIGVEAGFAAFGYKRWDLLAMTLAAVLQAINYAWGLVYFRLYDFGFTAWFWPWLATFATAWIAAPMALSIANALGRTDLSSKREVNS
jgi:energy-coupling factor transport system permease protein